MWYAEPKGYGVLHWIRGFQLIQNFGGIGKGSYGVVCAAIDTHTGEKVAIKKIKKTPLSFAN